MSRDDTSYVQKRAGFTDTVESNLTFTGTNTFNGAQTISSTSANALAVGPNGATNPTLQVDASTASTATGLQVKGSAAGGRTFVSVVSSGTNEGLSIDAKGSGSITLAGTSTGNINLSRPVVAGSITTNSGVAAPAGGSTSAAIMMGASGFGIFYGSGAPTVSASQGSLYLRTDGNSTSTRMYVNSSSGSGTTWTSVTTAA